MVQSDWFRELVPVSRKSRNFSGDIILFVSWKRRRSKTRNCTVILIFLPITSCGKTSFAEQAGRSFTDGFSDPKSFRDFRETGPWRDFLVPPAMIVSFASVFRDVTLAFGGTSRGIPKDGYEGDQYCDSAVIFWELDILSSCVCLLYIHYNYVITTSWINVNDTQALKSVVKGFIFGFFD